MVAERQTGFGMEQDEFQWGEKACRYAAGLVQAAALAPNVPGRGSATPAEKRAADFVQQKLAQVGVKNVARQPFQGLRSIWLFTALVFGFALSGHAAFWLLLVPLDGPGACIVATLFFGGAVFLYWRKFTFNHYPLQAYLPHGPSQNIIAVIPPQREPARRVVLTAHLDSHRAVWVFASDFIVRVYSVLAPLSVYGLAAAPLVYGLYAVSRVWLFGALAAGLALVHFLSWLTGMTADLGPYSPGANDNAAAAGAALVLAERLQVEPLNHTEVWLAFTGCEESGCDGMLALLDGYKNELEEAVFIVLEAAGIGEQLVYLTSEGLFGRQRIDPQLETLVWEVGSGFDIAGIDVPTVGAFTEAGPVRAKGRRGVCVLNLRAGSPLMPEWHRLTDTPDRLENEALSRLQEFVLALLDRLDRGENLNTGE